MSRVIEYKIFCQTENQVITGLTYAPLTPVCPHNHQHVVRAYTLQIIRELNEKTVEIKEDSVTTGGNFQVRSWELDVQAGDGSTGLDIKFDVPISIKNLGYLAGPELVGDYIDGYVIPNYTQQGAIGTLTQDAHPGDTVLHVSTSALEALHPLYRLTLNDGTKIQDLGEIKSIDKVAATVTMYTSVVHEFLSGSTLQLIIHRIKHHYLHNQQMMPIGESTVKGSALLPDMGARIIYTNVNAQPKKFHFFTELLY